MEIMEADISLKETEYLHIVHLDIVAVLTRKAWNLKTS